MSTNYRTSKAVRNDLNSRSNSGLLTLLLVCCVIAVLAMVVLTIAVPAVDGAVKQVCTNLPTVLTDAANVCK